MGPYRPSSTESILFMYYDERMDIKSNIALCLREFPRLRAKPKKSPTGRKAKFYRVSYVHIRKMLNFKNHYANESLINLIDNKSVYSLEECTVKYTFC